MMPPRFSVAWSLSSWATPELLELDPGELVNGLQLTLQFGNEKARARACPALAFYGDEAAVNVLRRVAEEDVAESVRLAARKALAELERKRAVLAGQTGPSFRLA